MKANRDPHREKPARFVVVGTLAQPLRGYGLDAHAVHGGLRSATTCYLEATSAWPYDPVSRVRDTDYASPYLGARRPSFGLGEPLGRASFADNAWSGPLGPKAVELLATADAALQRHRIDRSGAAGPAPAPARAPGTDPVLDEIAYASGSRPAPCRPSTTTGFTYGENIGIAAQPAAAAAAAAVTGPVSRCSSICGRPARPRKWRSLRPGNWEQSGLDIHPAAATYR
ncbi:MAG: hypothetical protein U0793_07500 [Gemmataceae bacterium]